jgi:hypothetical protein
LASITVLPFIFVCVLYLIKGHDFFQAVNVTGNTFLNGRGARTLA